MDISLDKLKFFRTGISKWRNENGLRKYPWRGDIDNFQIFITEILLRRTRADTVANHWDNFFTKFPTLTSIRTVSAETLQKTLHPLGLSIIRSKLIKEIAIQIPGERIPKSEKGLLDLPGVGKYIARMYRLMVYNKRGLIYDTNFRTLYSRFLGIKIKKDIKRDINIESISDQIIPKRNVREFILTILDFVALTCKPRGPNCGSCYLTDNCDYYRSKCEENMDDYQE